MMFSSRNLFALETNNKRYKTQNKFQVIKYSQDIVEQKKIEDILAYRLPVVIETSCQKPLQLFIIDIV